MRTLGRWVSRLRLHIGTRGLPHQVVNLHPEGGTKSRIVVVGPGLIPIPPNGWGAVETIIQEQIPPLAARYSLTILNSQRLIDWIRARPWSASLILCHSDRALPVALLMSKIFGAPVLAASHFPYLAFPHQWPPGFERVFRRLMSCAGILCLSPAIYDMFRINGFEGDLSIAPNGSNFKPLDVPEATKGAVCVGSVEPRKRQVDLMIRFPNLDIDFIGEVRDARIEEVDPNVRKRRFLGSGSREQLQETLGEYACLILMSDGEADSLVLYEAQLAGLEVIVTPQALGAQDARQPWIHVLDYESDDVERLEDLIAEIRARSQQTRSSIRRYAKTHYSWDSRVKPWMESIERLMSRDKD